MSGDFKYRLPWIKCVYSVLSILNVGKFGLRDKKTHVRPGAVCKQRIAMSQVSSTELIMADIFELYGFLSSIDSII